MADGAVCPCDMPRADGAHPRVSRTPRDTVSVQERRRTREHAVLLDRITAPAFRALARLRDARVFHPRGAAYEATWSPSAQDPLRPSGADPATSCRAVVRVSRGVGLPQAVPDVLGVAVKILDLHGPGHDQDLLLASAAGGRFGSRLLVPRRTFDGTRFSSLLPYRVEGRRTPVVATVQGEPDTTPEGTVDAHGVSVRLELLGPGAPLGVVALAARLPVSVAQDLRFDPWHTGEALRPAGWLNQLRRPAYRASQRGRDAPAQGARDGRLAS